MLDLVGPTLVDDETQIQMAIRRSLEESSQANEASSQKGKKQRGSGSAGTVSKFTSFGKKLSKTNMFCCSLISTEFFHTKFKAHF